MIKTIFLHIGLHKTATTTIQKTLYIERSKLANEGILFPMFNIGEEPITNHSIPFYSLFCNNPEEYHINIRKGITTNESIKKLHLDYCEQFEKQILNFHGETLIISGEDISLLSKIELINLQSYLKEITQPNVNIKVILMCRHPVSWFRSISQSFVKTRGITIEEQIYNLLLISHMYRNLIQTISEVFGQNCISVLRYEDIILHNNGPAGAILEIISKITYDIIKPEIRIENKSSNYETIHLINALNKYKTKSYKLKLLYITDLIKHISDMPGQRFMLSKGQSKQVWDCLSEDANWLCNRYLLKQYEFIDEDIKPETEIWNNETLIYLKNIFLKIPLKYKTIILWELTKESIRISEKTSFKKRKSIILFAINNIYRFAFSNK